MKQIPKIKDFSADVAPDTKPAICVFGLENVGTTRFGTTAPCDDGWIGWIAIDRNSKITVEERKERDNLPILINAKPFISHVDAMAMAVEERVEEVKKKYTEVVKRIFDATVALAAHSDVESIVIDRCSQLFDYILFSHFGRRNQIESFQRGAPNQELVDLINALGSKNLVLVCKASEVWADTGVTDAKGNKKQAPSGKLKPDGFAHIGRFVTAVIELSSKRTKVGGEDEEAQLKAKYACKIISCKGNTLLEGSSLSGDPYNISGEDITWSNVMTVIGAKN